MAEEDDQVNRLRTLNRNSKKTWKVLNGMLGRQRKNISRHFLIDGREVSDPGTIADQFVNYLLTNIIIYFIYYYYLHFSSTR